MTKAAAIQAVEDRAFAARKTIRFVCDKGGVYPSAWSRAKKTGNIGVDMLSRMERALTAIEAERLNVEG